jgi:hypothetical protein
MKKPTDFVICLPFAGKGRFLYLGTDGELTPDEMMAWRFHSFEDARRHWRQAGPSATITEIPRLHRAAA